MVGAEGLWTVDFGPREELAERLLLELGIVVVVYRWSSAARRVACFLFLLTRVTYPVIGRSGAADFPKPTPPLGQIRAGVQPGLSGESFLGGLTTLCATFG